LYIWRYLYPYWPWMSRHLDIWHNWLDPLALIINIRRELPHHAASRYQVAKQEGISGNTLPYLATGTVHSPVAWIIENPVELCNFRLAFYNTPVTHTKITFLIPEFLSHGIIRYIKFYHDPKPGNLSVFYTSPTWSIKQRHIHILHTTFVSYNIMI